MPRTDNDTWEITESVGATALGVASARAAETESDNPMISDPFARVFLDAVGDGVWNWHSTSQLPPELIDAETDVPLQRQAMVGYMASRTRSIRARRFARSSGSRNVGPSASTATRLPATVSPWMRSNSNSCAAAGR